MALGGPAQIQPAAVPFAARLRARFRPAVRYRRDEVALGYLFILFPMVIFLTFSFAGMIFDFWISFHHWDVLSAPVYRGLDEYRYLFNQDIWWRAIRNTIEYSLIVVPVQTVIAFTLALIVNQNIRGQKFFRTTFYFPSVTSSVAISLLFLYLMNNYGLVNYLIGLPNFTFPGWLYYSLRLLPAIALAVIVFRAVRGRTLSGATLTSLSTGTKVALALLVFYLINYFGVIAAAITSPSWLHSLLNLLALRIPQHFHLTGANWLSDTSTALPSIMGLNIWTTTGTLMIIFLAALQDVPRDVLEAAAIDGATGFQAVTRIVVPLVRPALFFVVANGLIGTLQIFDQAFVLSQGNGGPENSTMTAVLYIYNTAFKDGFYGVAAAGSFLLFAFIFVATITVRRVIGEEAR